MIIGYIVIKRGSKQHGYWLVKSGYRQHGSLLVMQKFMLNFDCRKMNARTDTAEALELLMTEVFVPGNGARAGVPNKAILISDGGANLDTATRTTIGQATAAKNQGQK